MILFVQTLPPYKLNGESKKSREEQGRKRRTMVIWSYFSGYIDRLYMNLLICSKQLNKIPLPLYYTQWKIVETNTITIYTVEIKDLRSIDQFHAEIPNFLSEFWILGLRAWVCFIAVRKIFACYPCNLWTQSQIARSRCTLEPCTVKKQIS